MSDELNRAYHSLDMGGDRASCAAVAWDWINDQAQEAIGLYDKDQLEIDSQNFDGGSGVIVLYYRAEPIAVATVFRTPLNRSTLIRWVPRA